MFGMRIRYEVFIGEFPVILNRDAGPLAIRKNLHFIPEEECILFRDNRRATDGLIDEIGNWNSAQYRKSFLTIVESRPDLIPESNQFVR